MKKGLTELVFILDRSGSMAGLESDTVGGYNSLLEKQKREPGECVVTTVLFDDRYELLHDRIDLRGVAPISEREYFVRGCTALLDALGRTISKIANAQKNTAEDCRAERVLFVVTTDGMENASREYSAGQVKRMVQHEQEKYGWEFLFLGANIDALETAEHIGIRRDRAAQYHADGQGIRTNFDAVSEACSDLRHARPMSANWKRDIDADYTSRDKK